MSKFFRHTGVNAFFRVYHAEMEELNTSIRSAAYICKLWDFPNTQHLCSPVHGTMDPVHLVGGIMVVNANAVRVGITQSLK